MSAFLMLSDFVSFTSQILPRRVWWYNFAASDLPCHCAEHCSVLTYNVNYDSPKQKINCNADRILDAISQSEADIVLLQETNKAWEELLVELLCSTKYPHYCFHHPEENIDRAASGMAILARYPIRNVATTKFYSENDTLLSGSVFPAMTASIEGTPLGNLEVANVHLRPPLELDGSATFSTARTTGPIREAEVKELLKRRQESSRSAFDLVAGDFNEQDGADALRLLEKNGKMIDALQEYVPSNKETHRWPFGKFLTMHKRLDHICYKPDRITCIGCGVISGYEEGASDHQPVLAKFVPSSSLSIAESSASEKR